jgi:hypothetical protein
LPFHYRRARREIVGSAFRGRRVLFHYPFGGAGCVFGRTPPLANTPRV